MRGKCAEAIVPSVALVGNINSTIVGGPALVEPWTIGRRIQWVIALVGTMTTNDAITFKPQLRRKGTSTWDDILNPAGQTVTFTQQVNAGTAGSQSMRLKEGLAVFGELDFTRVNTVAKANGGKSTTYDYDAIRLTGINAAAQNVSVSAVAEIWDLYDEPSSTHGWEDLSKLQRYKDGDANNATP